MLAQLTICPICRFPEPLDASFLARCYALANPLTICRQCRVPGNMVTGTIGWSGTWSL